MFQNLILVANASCHRPIEVQRVGSPLAQINVKACAAVSMALRIVRSDGIGHLKCVPDTSERFGAHVMMG